jgi:N-acetylglutamate synthase-like GNAT family acetyltransferase
LGQGRCGRAALAGGAALVYMAFFIYFSGLGGQIQPKTTFMGLKQIDYGTPEYRQMVKLREDILRKPLGMQLLPNELEHEKGDILLAAFDEDKILACCVLTPISKDTVRLRQMAVQNNLQGKGIGASIMSFAETIARDKDYKNLMMHARDSSIGFFEKLGYKIKGEEFMEVNLPHHIMEKKLK